VKIVGTQQQGAKMPDGTGDGYRGVVEKALWDAVVRVRRVSRWMASYYELVEVCSALDRRMGQTIGSTVGGEAIGILQCRGDC